jgi:putative ABC transport system substrate-binding protein
MIQRRQFISLLCGAAFVMAPITLMAQQSSRPVRIGFLTAGGDPGTVTYQAFRQELRRLGYFEGQNMTIEFRSAGGNNGKVQGLAAELVALPVDIIVTEGVPATIAAKRATAVIPIVIGAVGDPIASGLVQNLARPGGNVTGFSALAPELGTKRLDLLREAVPSLDRVGILWSPANATNGKPQVEAIVSAAKVLGIATEIEGADNADGIVGAIEALTQRKVSALIIVADSVFFGEHKRIVGLATVKRLPAIYPDRMFVAAGGLMSYGPDQIQIWRRAASYVDRILKGMKPGDLPIEQPAKFELAINMKAAAAIGLSIPPGLPLRADEVIE